MDNFARVENGVAIDVAADYKKRFHKDLWAQFQAVPTYVKPGWRFEGGLWVDPAGMPAPPASNETAAIPQLMYISALETMYDAKAQERFYDDRYTCALRAGYVGPFQAEATAFAVWMDSCNLKAYGLLAQVLAGEIKQPTIAEVLAQMPELVWPPQVTAE